jgi:uncharacterized membrane protein YfcA
VFYDDRMLHFPTSGVEVNPLLPLLVAFLVSALTAPAGVSGAFLLLPFQVSVLGFTSPAVSPTNLIYNVVATPSGVYRYVREGRVVWPLAWVVILGTLPGVFVGALLRVTVLSDPDTFEVFVGLVLLYLGGRLLYEVLADQWTGEGDAVEAGRSTVRVTEASRLRIEYEYGDKRYAFGTPTLLVLSLAVGVVGGIYSIGGGSIIAPFLVTVLGLPIYTVAGATLIGTFVTSIAGVVVFEGLAAAGFGGNTPVAPDWLLGLTLGIGGLAGTYAGARLQRHVPERLIRSVLGALVTLLALRYAL